jgi:hypothetical protein
MGYGRVYEIYTYINEYLIDVLYSAPINDIPMSGENVCTYVHHVHSMDS